MSLVAVPELVGIGKADARGAADNYIGIGQFLDESWVSLETKDVPWFQRQPEVAVKRIYGWAILLNAIYD